MQEIDYNQAELSNLKYVKVVYTGSDGEPSDVKCDVKIMGDSFLALYFRRRAEFKIKFPQHVIVNFVTDSGMYVADTMLQDVKQADSTVYLTLLTPKTLVKRQDRKYYRVKLKRSCVLIATDKNNHNTCFMSRLVDVSAGGVLIHRLESMFNSDFVTINPSDYEYFNIVLFLDVDIVLKLSARYVRQEKGEDSNRYAFEFININRNDIDTISKYVTKEQLEQIKLQNKMKN